MAEKILIIDDDIDTLKLVGLMLQRQGYQISAATNGPQGIAKAIEEHPDLILLDVMMPEMDGYEVARRLRQNPLTAETPILMFTAKSQLDDKVSGFEAGADDYLTKPTHPSELQAHVRALLNRAKKSTAPSQPEAIQQQTAHLIGVIAARGGLGVSTIALNLAVGLFNRTNAEVVLVELVPGKGTLGFDLGVTQKTLVKFLQSSPADITAEQLKKALIPHLSGIKLLLASESPSDLSLVNQISQYEALIERLATLSRYAVLDFGSGLLPFAQKLLPRCQDAVVIVEGALNTILHSKALIEDLIQSGVPKERIAVVLNNRVRSETLLPATTVQEKLGYPVMVTFTPAPELIAQAIRMQTAAILCQPDSLMAKQISRLVDHLLRNDSPAK